MRIIDADALVHDLIHNRSFYPVCVRRAIEAAPTIEAKPVVHGEWEEQVITYYECFGEGEWDEFYYEHKECGYKCDFEFNYCPNCGADMRGET